MLRLDMNQRTLVLRYSSNVGTSEDASSYPATGGTISRYGTRGRKAPISSFLRASALGFHPSILGAPAAASTDESTGSPTSVAFVSSLIFRVGSWSWISVGSRPG